MVGRYELQSLLAAGALGGLFRARIASGPEEGRVVAVRCIPRTPGVDATAVERLTNAGFAAMELRHPKIAAVLDVAVVDREIAVVSEHLDGVLLSSLLRPPSGKRSPVPVQVALRLALDTLEAVRAVRGPWIELFPDVETDEERLLASGVHGGLVPDDLLIAAFGETMLLEAGVAGVALTVPAVLDNPEVIAFRAPEQLEAKGPIDERADVFTVGILLWELVVGRTLFGSGPSPRPVAASPDTGAVSAGKRKVLEAPIQRLDVIPALKGKVSKPIADFVARCLARNPDARFATLDLAIEALKGLGPVVGTQEAVAKLIASHALGARTTEDPAASSSRAAEDGVEASTPGAPKAAAPDAPPSTVKNAVGKPGEVKMPGGALRLAVKAAPSAPKAAAAPSAPKAAAAPSAPKASPAAPSAPKASPAAEAPSEPKVSPVAAAPSEPQPTSEDNESDLIPSSLAESIAPPAADLLRALGAAPQSLAPGDDLGVFAESIAPPAIDLLRAMAPTVQSLAPADDLGRFAESLPPDAGGFSQVPAAVVDAASLTASVEMTPTPPVGRAAVVPPPLNVAAPVVAPRGPGAMPPPLDVYVPKDAGAQRRKDPPVPLPVAAPAAAGTFPALPKAERRDPLADSPFGGDTTSAPVVRAVPGRDRSGEVSDDDFDFSPRKNKSKKLVIGLSAAALLLVAGIVGLVMSGGDHPNPTPAAPVAVAPPVERATSPEEPAAPQPAAARPEPVKPAPESAPATPKAQPAEPGAPTLSSSWASKFAVPAAKK